MQKSRTLIIALVLVLAAVLIGGATGLVMYSLWDLPEVQTLEEYRPSITSRVYGGDNRLLAEYFVENRTPVQLADVPEMLIKALIATEDARFYDHRGLDPRGIARAFYRNIRAGKILEGGSTLTQQLAKVLFLTPERSYARKLKEMTLALRIEQHYTKQEILSLYLNQIYFGSGAYGVASAAQTYFGKSLKDLNVAECSLLAGLPRSPKYYSPFRSRPSALSRRAYVLGRMAAAGIITRQQAEEAKGAPLPLQPSMALQGPAPAPYFMEYVRQKVEERFGSSILYSGGLNIYTSIDGALQAHAEQAVSTGLAKLETKSKRKQAQPLQAGLLALEASTGHILAMVGGRDFGESQFNRSWQALRQPGSVFKPVIYAAALEKGFSPADMVSDSPLSVKVDNQKTWKPENFTKSYQGDVTLRRALAQSLNVPTVKLLSRLGIQETIRFSRKLGIRSPLRPFLPLALGSSDVTLLELTSVYGVFGNNGVRIEPAAILQISDSAGNILYRNDDVPSQVIKPETAYLITNLLKGVVERGTGWRAKELGRPVAGKTGTTNDYRDAWFIGYTPHLVAGVWVGYDNQESLGPKATGAKAALPIWLEFMKKAHEGKEQADFAVPENIVFRQIDPRTGLLSTETCRQAIREAFLQGTEPKKFCTEPEAPADDEVIQDEAPD